jgi:hypothetical protein
MIPAKYYWQRESGEQDVGDKNTVPIAGFSSQRVCTALTPHDTTWNDGNDNDPARRSAHLQGKVAHPQRSGYQNRQIWLKTMQDQY